MRVTINRIYIEVDTQVLSVLWFG